MKNYKRQTKKKKNKKIYISAEEKTPSIYYNLLMKRMNFNN